MEVPVTMKLVLFATLSGCRPATHQDLLPPPQRMSNLYLSSFGCGSSIWFRIYRLAQRSSRHRVLVGTKKPFSISSTSVSRSSLTVMETLSSKLIRIVYDSVIPQTGTFVGNSFSVLVAPGLS